MSPDLLQLQARALAVAKEGVAQFGQSNDSWINGFSREFAQIIAAQGWIGMGWPAECGGRDRPPLERVIVAEQLIAHGAPVSSYWVADRQMGPSIIAYGTDDQRERYLPDILAGRSMWCIGMSEPNAGSDLANLSTTARAHGDRWIINGQKIWTSGAYLADFCYLICRTTPRGPSPHAGISEIVVPMDTPGIEVRRIRDLAGYSHFCEVFFTDVEVPASNLVGVEGAAFQQTMKQLEHERGGIDRLMSNRPLFDRAVAAADTDDPLVRQRIARLESSYRLGRLLVYREAMRQAPTGFSAATKCFCTEHEQSVATFAASVLGARATVTSGRSDDDAREICYAPAYTIAGGTSNVLRTLVGERILGLPREPRAPRA